MRNDQTGSNAEAPTREWRMGAAAALVVSLVSGMSGAAHADAIDDTRDDVAEVVGEGQAIVMAPAAHSHDGTNITHWRYYGLAIWDVTGTEGIRATTYQQQHGTYNDGRSVRVNCNQEPPPTGPPFVLDNVWLMLAEGGHDARQDGWLEIGVKYSCTDVGGAPWKGIVWQVHPTRNGSYLHGQSALSLTSTTLGELRIQWQPSDCRTWELAAFGAVRMRVQWSSAGGTCLRSVGHQDVGLETNVGSNVNGNSAAAIRKAHNHFTTVRHRVGGAWYLMRSPVLVRDWDPDDNERVGAHLMRTDDEVHVCASITRTCHS